MKWKVTADSLVDDSVIEWEVEADSPEEAEDAGITFARESAVADTGSVEIEPLEEDKQLVCDRLLAALQVTRELYDLMELRYMEHSEVVIAEFANGSKKVINVALDSGVAVIKDIMRQIL